ncbi:MULTISPECIES: lipopolysaccharide biosynthesis protein [Protofrankia]|uniref:Polysaccharide biosynthesis protein n=1 Tax=Candidatus Protofrankia datiscae TaxID=2716812 RepID=F8AWC9_9ACTN|nr:MULTISPECIES: polysaccharide biosynthesis protein [Protofrankia]AEH08330.1 polysaccharide biosynthesis protein [Candidatus Protofrankia datiscae]
MNSADGNRAGRNADRNIVGVNSGATAGPPANDITANGITVGSTATAGITTDITATAPVARAAESPPPEETRHGHAGLAQLLAIAMSMVGTQIVTSVLGAVFWSLAARTYAVHEVGVGSAAIAAMTVLGSVGMLGLGTLLMAKLPTVERESDRLRLMRASIAVVGVTSGLLALVWTGVTPFLSETLRPVSSSVLAAVLFCVGVVLFAVTSTLDFALLSAARGAVQFVRNVVTSVVKLGLIPVFVVIGWTSGLDLYLSWVAGMALSLPVCYRYFRRPAPEERSPDGAGAAATPRQRFAGLRQLREMRKEAGGHHLLNLALQLPTLLLPILAALAATAADTAYFTTARLAATFFFIIPFALAIAVFAQSGQNEEQALAKIRSTLPLGLVAAVATFLIAAPCASLVMTIFGGAYTSGVAVSAFRIMMLAGVPLVIKDHYVSLRRVQGRLGSALRVVGAGTAMEIVFALVGGHLGGVNGLCWGWLLAVVLEAVITLPPLAVVWREPRATIAMASPQANTTTPLTGVYQRMAASFYPLELLRPIDERDLARYIDNTDSTSGEARRTHERTISIWHRPSRLERLPDESTVRLRPSTRRALANRPPPSTDQHRPSRQNQPE